MKLREFARFAALGTLVCALAFTPLLAQNANTGEIRGTVRDSSGAVIPGVSVSIKNVGTGVVMSATTNQAGLYDVPFLAPGNYTLIFSKQGFQELTRQGIVLQVATAQVDGTLQIGTTTQQVIVSAPPPLVETQTSGQNVDLSTRAIEAAPTVGTDWRSEMIQLIPGVNTGGGCFALGAGCGENGNIDAVLGEEVYNYGDVLTLIRGKHTIKVGGEYDRDYQNYTNCGDITSGNFEFNGGVTGIPYADFLSGDVYGWFVYESDETGAHMWNSALFAGDDYQVTPRVTLNLGLRWQLQSGWGVKNNLFGTYDPILPNSADGGKYKGAILFGSQSDTAFGGTIKNMTTIQNPDNREVAPRVGIAWAPRSLWTRGIRKSTQTSASSRFFKGIARLPQRIFAGRSRSIRLSAKPRRYSASATYDPETQRATNCLRAHSPV